MNRDLSGPQLVTRIRQFETAGWINRKKAFDYYRLLELQPATAKQIAKELQRIAASAALAERKQLSPMATTTTSRSSRTFVASSRSSRAAVSPTKQTSLDPSKSNAASSSQNNNIPLRRVVQQHSSKRAPLSTKSSNQTTSAASKTTPKNNPSLRSTTPSGRRSVRTTAQSPKNEPLRSTISSRRPSVQTTIIAHSPKRRESSHATPNSPLHVSPCATLTTTTTTSSYSSSVPTVDSDEYENDPLFLPHSQLHDYLSDAEATELFVEMCFFARLGFVQPPCCLHCGFAEAMEDQPIQQTSSCPRWVVLRKRADQPLHPDTVRDNVVLVQCHVVRQLQRDRTVAGWSLNRNERRLVSPSESTVSTTR